MQPQNPNPPQQPEPQSPQPQQQWPEQPQQPMQNSDATVAGNGSPSSMIIQYLQASPKRMYVFSALALLLVIVVVLLQSGLFGDQFTRTISDRQLRNAVQTEVNNRKAEYGFSVTSASSITCDERIKNKRGATVDCSINATRILAGKLEGPVKVTVRVATTQNNSTALKVRLENISKIE